VRAVGGGGLLMLPAAVGSGGNTIPGDDDDVYPLTALSDGLDATKLLPLVMEPSDAGMADCSLST